MNPPVAHVRVLRHQLMLPIRLKSGSKSEKDYQEIVLPVAHGLISECGCVCGWKRISVREG